MNPKRRFPTKLMLLIRVAVGGYVLYLSYTLFRDRAAGSIQPLPLALILVIFVICGAGVIAHSAYLYFKGMYEGGPADIEVDEEENGSASATVDEKTLSTDGAVDGEFAEVEEIPAAGEDLKEDDSENGSEDSSVNTDGLI